MQTSMKKMIQGALILSIASFIAKILSAVYRVPFQNMVGNTGFYVYQQVYPFYGIGMTFALSGFPVFLSTLVAQSPKEEWNSLLKRSGWLFSILSGISFISLYSGAPLLAHWMGDSRLQPMIQMVSWMFVCMPFLVILRGYYQGRFNMLPTAVSQVLEQSVRVSVILMAAWMYTLAQQEDVYKMGTWAMLSAPLAAVISMVYLMRCVKRDGLQELRRVPVEHQQTFSWKKLVYRFSTEAVLLCLLSSILVMYQLIDSFTLFNGLVKSGIEEEIAKGLKGVFDRGQPIVQLGLVVGIGFSSAYLPMLAKVHQKGEEFHVIATSLMKMTLTFSLVATIGLMAILPRLNHMLFGDVQQNGVLAVYIVSVLLTSLILSVAGIFQSTHLYRVPFSALLMGMGVKWGINGYLVEQWGTMGASVATVTGLLITLVYLLVKLKITYHRLYVSHTFLIKVILASLVVGGTVLLLEKGVCIWALPGTSRTMDSIVAFVEVGAGAMVFLLYSAQMKLFTVREWMALPKGKAVLRWLTKIEKKLSFKEKG